MNFAVTATGRPVQRAPLLSSLGLFSLVAIGVLEGVIYFRGQLDSPEQPWTRVRVLFEPALERYLPLRNWALDHPWPSAVIAGLGILLLLVTYRFGLIVWHNQIVARLSGTKFIPQCTLFPVRSFDLLKQIGRRPKGTYFVGMSPRPSFLFWRWKPIYISQRQKTMHRHVVGKTGSGKTASVLWPAILQDALDGKGVLVIDAKGSDENIGMMKGLAALAGRERQLRIFALPAWNQPHIFSHTYNMVWVKPRSPGNAGGDPVATAERVFSVMPLGDNEYYNTQGQIVFVNLCRLLHGMVDANGYGIPFTLKDVSVCLKGVGNNGGWAGALAYCMEKSTDREASQEISSQISRLGKDVHKSFSGIVGALDKFLSPLVNAYDPDIIFEEVLETNGIVYVQLPANLFRLQAPAMGKVMLMDVQQEGSLRQVFRIERNQTPFSVTVDEFYNFADESIIDSLNKLRDANLEYTLAHQSIADLELVSKEFATAVWDNTRTKDILNQDNPELCEKLAKSIGTEQIIEKTVRQQQGALFTSLTTGDASSKLVEAYKLHPNAIKSLARCGQGYLFSDEELRPISYGMIPPTITADYPVPRKQTVGTSGLRLYETFIGARPAVKHQPPGTAPPIP